MEQVQRITIKQYKNFIFKFISGSNSGALGRAAYIRSGKCGLLI